MPVVAKHFGYGSEAKSDSLATGGGISVDMSDTISKGFLKAW